MKLEISDICEPLVSDLICTASFTAASKKYATLAKSSSTNPLEVRAGVPEMKSNSSSKITHTEIKK